MPDVPSLSTDAARSRTPAPEPAPEEQAPEAPPVIVADTAILVILTQDGQCVLSNNLNLPVTVVRESSADVAYGLLACAMKDLTVSEAALHSAEQTVRLIEAKQAEAISKMREAQANGAVEQALAQRGGIRG